MLPPGSPDNACRLIRFRTPRSDYRPQAERGVKRAGSAVSPRGRLRLCRRRNNGPPGSHYLTRTEAAPTLAGGTSRSATSRRARIARRDGERITREGR